MAIPSRHNMVKNTNQILLKKLINNVWIYLSAFLSNDFILANCIWQTANRSGKQHVILANFTSPHMGKV